MGNRRALANRDEISVTTTPTVYAITGIPDDCWIDSLIGTINTIAGGCTSITWAIGVDALCDHLWTTRESPAIELGDTDATDGGVTTPVAMGYKTHPLAVAGTLNLLISCNAGTCKLTPQIVHVED